MSCVGGFGVVLTNIEMKLLHKFVIINDTESKSFQVFIESDTGIAVHNKKINSNKCWRFLKEVSNLKLLNEYSFTPKYKGNQCVC